VRALRRQGAGQGVQLDVAAGDRAVIAVTMLYRMRWLRAEQYLQILVGFVRPEVH
jgi:hypothetical protein